MKQFLVAAILFAGLLHGAVLPHPLFTDHAVLLRSENTPVFGYADPGEAVEVTLGRMKGNAVADNSGKWLVLLDLSSCGQGPFILKMNEVTATDVLVGEVWLCSGQSNMQFTLRNALNGREEVENARHSRLRCFTVDRVAAAEPAETVRGKWQVSSPVTAGGFTAVGYFFGRELMTELDVPVGLIDSSWGGTQIEAWVDKEKLSSLPVQKANIDAMEHENASYEETVRKYVNNYLDFQRKFNRRESDCKVSEPAAWGKFRFPGRIPGEGGIVLIRREVEIHRSMAGKNLTFFCGQFNASSEVFWNGDPVGSIPLFESVATENSRLTIPAHSVRQGKNELVIRLFSPEGGIVHKFGHSIAGRISLAGEWEYAYLYEFPPLSAPEKAELPQRPPARPRPQNLPARNFNGMISPLMPYGLSGVIWYQGERNVPRAKFYHEAFTALIEEWRRGFGRDLPFYFCQLANLHAKRTDPNERSEWAELREAQFKTLNVPGTGMAVLADIGEAGDIHPLDKQEAGKRLALWALAGTYGRKVVCSGPLFRSFRIEGGKIRLYFDHTGGGLAAKELPETIAVNRTRNITAKLVRNTPASQLEGFAVAGEDGRFHWADAKIEGDTVVVSSSQVPKPVQVRFAWANNPTFNLYNRAGLPASPFRTGK